MNLFISGIQDGLIISISTVLLTFILDLFSFNNIQLLFQKKDGKELYKRSVFANLFNHLILGTFSYGLLTYLISLESYAKTYLGIGLDYISLLLIQSIGYYFVHIIMHTNKFYFIHKFHHQYSDIVIPMAANAVSSYEYLLAYMMPFIVGIILFKPDRVSN
jgi:sterol desaturase/sphingolipid hydroxylase (fatty acid hydroxylase superfamily)